MMTALWIFIGVIAGAVVGVAAVYIWLVKSLSKSLWR